MRCQDERDISALVRNARRRHGLSQRQLALRAGTSQDAISRIERGAESPTLGRLRRLLALMGEDVTLGTAARTSTLSEEDGRTSVALSPRERLLESASWNLLATTLELAGAEARRIGHPATRQTRR